MQKAKRIQNPFLLLQQRGNECTAYGCSNAFYNSEDTATATHFVKFPSLPSQSNCWCDLITRQNSKDGIVSSKTVLCHHNFIKTDIKKSFLRWKLLTGSVPSENLPCKTLYQNKKENYL